MLPETLKTIHVSCVGLSYTLFAVRGWWVLHDAPQMHQRWVKVVPHLIDTGLLVSAVALTSALDLHPPTTPWLMAKITALLLYILLGSVAIKRGKTRQTRIWAWAAAQLVFFYIVITAIRHDPVPWNWLA